MACAFFSGIEIAFISSNKLRLELKSKQGDTIANLLSPFVKNPSKFISTTLVGNNVSLVIYSIVMEQQILEHFFSNTLPVHNTVLKIFLETLVSTIFILFTAEFLPKVLFRINPDLILQVLAYPFLIFYYIFYPLVHFITWLARKLLSGVFRMQWNEGEAVFSKIDLDRYISESSSTDIPEDAEVDTEIFRNAMDFGNTKARECMVPRNELVAVSKQASVSELYQQFLESGHSRILVFEDSIEHIIGYVHQTSLFSKPKNLKDCLIPIVIASETTPIHELLNKLTQERKSMAVVIDEFGGTAGIISIEDILEEVLGEIKDEHDEESLNEKILSDGTYIFSARLEIDYINQKYQLDLPTGEYETLGGYIVSISGNIPHQKDIISDQRYQFEILRSDNTRIGEVGLKRLSEDGR